MYNQFGPRRPQNTNTPQTTPSTPPLQDTMRAQIGPDFLKKPTQPNGVSSPARMSRIATNGFGRMNPKDQRSALFQQARDQIKNPSLALPGGLSERQRMDFEMLKRTDPVAAERTLMNYQKNADIRYNRPTPGVPPGAGITTNRPPTNFNGPRRSFGA